MIRVVLSDLQRFSCFQAGTGFPIHYSPADFPTHHSISHFLQHIQSCFQRKHCCDTFFNLCINPEGRQRHLRIQAKCAKCGCKLVCLCNQPGKLALKTRRGGNDNLSECCGLTSRNRLTLGLLLWLLRRAPDVLGLIRGTQEAQQ